MASTVSRQGMLISSHPLGTPLRALVDGTTKYLSGTLGFVNSSNEAKAVNDNSPDSDVIGLFKTELDSAASDNLETHMNLWVGAQVILNNDPTNPITYVGESCYVFDNDTVASDGGAGTFLCGVATELEPDGIANTVKVLLRSTV